jgi:hypothetical protein
VCVCVCVCARARKRAACLWERKMTKEDASVVHTLLAVQCQHLNTTVATAQLRVTAVNSAYADIVK